MNILVAEHDPATLEVLQGLLLKWGHQVVVAHDGEEAERLLLGAGAPAVAILDSVMPKRSGLRVCRTLRARNTGSPYVIMIAAKHEREDIQAAFECGVDELLPKPVDPPELRARLQAAERIVTLQEQLRERAQQAEAANRAKSDFLASMSHELRTPLGSIIGFAELLEEKLFGDLTPKQEEYVGDIVESGRHLLALINDILDLSRIEAGRMDLKFTDFPIATLLENSLVMVKEKCLKHGISLSLDLPEPVRGLVISADERELKQIMFNLLSNAAKFTPDGGQIHVSARLTNAEAGTRNAEHDEVGARKSECGIKTDTPNSDTPTSDFRVPRSELEISVADTGIGIASEHREKIFEAFYQVAGGSKGKTPGTGLGLALVRRMVALHGGKIWVESEGEGKGSTFRFTLALSSADHRFLQAIQARLNLAGQKQDDVSVLLFTLDSDAVGRAMPARDGVTGITADEVWAALAGRTVDMGFEPVCSGGEFMVTAVLRDKVSRAAMQKQFRRLLKDVLFRLGPSAVASFSCGMATCTDTAAGAAELLAAARKAQLRERERIAAGHIVVVDDESQVRMTIRKQLVDMGYSNVSEASGGVELFRLLRKATPDLIILDIYMPDMNGYEVIGRLKGHRPTAEIPVLIMSGLDVDSSELRRKSPTTAIHLLAKPVDQDELKNRAAHLL